MSRATRISNVPDTLDLDTVSTRGLFVARDMRIKPTRKADVSQVGEERMKQPIERGIQCPQKFRVAMSSEDIKDFLVAPTFARLAAYPAGAVPTVDYVEISVVCNWSVQLTADEIRGIQALLVPPKEPKPEQLIGAPEVISYFEELTGRRLAVGSIAAAYLTAQTELNPAARAKVDEMHVEAATTGTVTGDTGGSLVDINFLESAGLNDVVALYYIVQAADESGIFGDYVAMKLWNATRGTPDEVRDSRCAALLYGDAPAVSSAARSRIEMSSMDVPPATAQSLEAANPFRNGNVVVAWYGDPTVDEQATAGTVEPGRTNALDALCAANRLNVVDHELVAAPNKVLRGVWMSPAATNTLVLGAGCVVRINAADLEPVAFFAYGLFASLQVTGTGALPATRAAGGMALSAGVRIGLYRDSREVLNVHGYGTLADGISIDMPTDVVTAAIAELLDPERQMIALVTRVVSFKKSGHNATANNLPHTIMMIAAAVDCKHLTTSSNVMNECSASVYHSTHGLSQRLSMIHFAYLAQTNQLSYAFSRRLMPYAPGTVAYHLAAQFFAAMDRAGFWDLIKQKAMYERFLAAYDRWKPNAHFEAPYALYMYGSAREENQAFKSACNSIMAYANDIGKVMPGTTLSGSMALKKLAGSAANNDVIARFHVGGFAGALSAFTTRHMRIMMESSTKKAAKIAGVPAAAGLLE